MARAVQRFGDMETSTAEALPESSAIHETRETWLVQASELLSPIFRDAGYALPSELQVSCGWPSAGGLATRKRVIGQCWDATTAQDAMPHVFISPVLGDPPHVLETLAHELVHATVGCKHGHKGEFKKCMHAIGLEGKPTATHAGETLKARLNDVASMLGKYPHGALHGINVKKQSTRLLKIECPECGYVARITQKWADVGMPTCPCGSEFVEA